MSESHFSKTYPEARGRFLDAAAKLGADVRSHRIDAECPDELAIDVATLGEADAPAVVVSSGIHGVEGFFGSAAQLALLDRLGRAGVEPGIRYVLIHGMNPFGFSRLRRFNEDNVDLNRNFLEHIGDYTGAPDGYVRLNGFLNPESPPSRFEPYSVKAIWNIGRYGLKALRQAVAGGQYEYPRGIFFGGTGPSRSAQIVFENCDSWIGQSRKIVHIDLHTGLGPFGKYKLLLVKDAGPEGNSWYTDAFGIDAVKPFDAKKGRVYTAKGLFGAWLQKRFAEREYRFVTAEFGTYGNIRVLGAIRAENRLHHYGSKDSPMFRPVKAALLECFCPKDASWRKQVIESSQAVIHQGVRALRRGQ